MDETSLTEEEEQGGGRSRAPPTTNVWVAAPGVYNLRHLLLYHRHQVRPSENPCLVESSDANEYEHSDTDSH